ncbi:MAG: histone H1 [Alphaproteobacteria bacterium]|nr:histone H1 [Alphaproteobacteria bacterium]
MAKKAKKAAGRTPTKSRKTKKAIAVKSVKTKKPAARKPARKVARRSSADVAKLRKAVLAGSRAKKPADAIAKELGISRAYVYALKRKA